MDAILGFIGAFIYYTWWLWLLFILAPMAADAWLAWRQKEFEHHLKWSFLEIVIPREITKNPQAMEQVLYQIHHMRNYPGDIKEIWWDGEVTLWYTFEIFSMDGAIRFYMRVPQKYRSLIEAAWYAYYPDIEIIEAEDYMKQFPATIPELYRDGKSFYGVELELDKSPAYPLRSYKDFESPDEDKQYDPMSAFVELLSKIEPGQMAAIQYIISPASAGPHDKHAFKEYQQVVKDIRERKGEEAHGHDGNSVHSKASFEMGPLPMMEIETGAHEEDLSQGLRKAIMTRTPGETQILEAVEENLAQPQFNVLIRYIYMDKTERYSNNFPRRAMFGLFNQFTSRDLNALSRNPLVTVRGKLWEWPVIFPKVRLEFRRQRLYYDYRHREIPAHTFFGHLLMRATFKFDWKKLRFKWGSHFDHMGARTVATLFHPPTAMVLTGPHIKRVDSRKGGPPAGMAIFGDEGDIEKFQ